MNEILYWFWNIVGWIFGLVGIGYLVIFIPQFFTDVEIDVCDTCEYQWPENTTIIMIPHSEYVGKKYIDLQLCPITRGFQKRMNTDSVSHLSSFARIQDTLTFYYRNGWFKIIGGEIIKADTVITQKEK